MARDTPALRTPRLRLDPVSRADAEEMAEVLADPAIYRFTGGDPPTVAQLRSRFAIWAEGGPAHEVWNTWIVRSEGTAVGFVQASLRDGRDGVREGLLAWVLGPAWEGQGYATEAAAEVARWSAKRGVARLTAHIAAGHVASERVAARLGLTLTDRLVEGERVWSAATADHAVRRGRP